MIETTMYDIDENSCSMEPSSKKRKLNMTLDLQSLTPVSSALKSSKAADKFLTTAVAGGSDLLSTPDLFMLASPDLERFIVQPNAAGFGVLTTPTPTTNILFPRSVTEEQEAYARGFVDALAELHNKNEPAAVTSSSTAGVPALSRPTTTVLLAPASSNAYVFTSARQPSTTCTALPMMVDAANNNSGTVLPPVVKVETAQTVPAPPSVVSSSPLDIKPINMDEQEHAKLERKRARNRLAATRCRNRKLERISKLEDRVAELKQQNGQLVQTASALREEVARLKRGIVEHTRRGCQVMLSHNLM